MRPTRRCCSRSASARARALTTVLPDDAANVFITLSARSLNKALQIIARGEIPSTESKLIQAGADRVVLPAHIGAERIAELILFKDMTGLREGEKMRTISQELGRLGLDLEIVAAAKGSRADGATVAEIEHLAAGAFMVAAVERKGGKTLFPAAARHDDPGRRRRCSRRACHPYRGDAGDLHRSGRPSGLTWDKFPRIEFAEARRFGRACEGSRAMGHSFGRVAWDCFVDLGITIVYATIAGLLIVGVVATDDGTSSLLRSALYASLLPASVAALIAADCRDARRRRAPGAASPGTRWTKRRHGLRTGSRAPDRPAPSLVERSLFLSTRRERTQMLRDLA